MPTELSAAQYLKAKQAYCRQCLNLGPERPEEEVLARALQAVKRREDECIRQGQYIREGIFQFQARVEEMRWNQTSDVIHRVSPGLNEDPAYLEIIARQAASIEIVLCQKDTGSPNPKALALCERILIGTRG